jgi:hypothetical protein
MTTPNEMKPAATVETSDGGRCAVDALLGVWVSVKELEAGYYWCRLNASDDQPTIVKICDQTSEEELALWEFERGEWEPLTSYDNAWQFLPITSPNTPSETTTG